MPPFYVKQFKLAHKCSLCATSRLVHKGKIYSLCQNHLDEAAEKFRCWYNQRKAIGRCCSCNRKSVRGTGRCGVHAKINRERISAWMAKNYQEHAARQREQKLAWIAAGCCGRCKEHRPLDGDFRNCKTCRKNHRR